MTIGERNAMQWGAVLRDSDCPVALDAAWGNVIFENFLQCSMLPHSFNCDSQLYRPIEPLDWARVRSGPIPVAPRRGANSP